MTHTRYDSSGRGIGPSQRPLPDNTQHTQDTDIHAPVGVRTSNPSKRAAVDCAATGIGTVHVRHSFILGNQTNGLWPGNKYHAIQVRESWERDHDDQANL
jgi:hypothetical protein